MGERFCCLGGMLKGGETDSGGEWETVGDSGGEWERVGERERQTVGERVGERERQTVGESGREGETDSGEKSGREGENGEKGDRQRKRMNE